jgi:hypothetical protein
MDLTTRNEVAPIFCWSQATALLFVMSTETVIEFIGYNSCQELVDISQVQEATNSLHDTKKPNGNKNYCRFIHGVSEICTTVYIWEWHQQGSVTVTGYTVDSASQVISYVTMGKLNKTKRIN